MLGAFFAWFEVGVDALRRGVVVQHHLRQRPTRRDSDDTQRP